MTLKSKLFHGDRTLAAAAISDSAHIRRGAHGTHVEKIQRALIILGDATISDDDLRRNSYGSSTADAVLAYKQERSIINRSYQTSADNIVGKMTMARLDDEMVNWEAQPHPLVEIRPLSFARTRPARSTELVAALQQSRSLELNFALGASFADLAGPPFALRFLPQKVLVLDRNSLGRIEVLGGTGGEISVFDPDLVLIEPVFDDFLKWRPTTFGDKFVIQDDPQPYSVKSGAKLGEAELRVVMPDGNSAHFFVVVTKRFPSPPPFNPPQPHNHQPCGQWATIRADPESSDKLVAQGCSACDTPKCVLDAAKLFRLQKAPLAIEHLDHYLSGGGADFIEDINILHWINQDANIRARLKQEIFPAGKKKRSEGHFSFEGEHVFDTSKTENFALSFGQIDRVDFSVDFSDDTVRVWFQDRYEWHPVYPGLYTKLAGDKARPDNCAHAAGVEMKNQGARDYWMKGQAVVPLSLDNEVLTPFARAGFSMTGKPYRFSDWSGISAQENN